MFTITSENRKDYKISFFITSFFIISALNSTVKSVLPIPEFLWLPISVVCGLFFVYTLLKAFKIMMQRSGKCYLGVFYLLGLLYVISVIRNISNLSYIQSYALWTFVFCMPIGIAAFSIRDYKVLYEVLLKYSYYITGMLSFIIFFPSEENEYDMFFSASLVFPLLLHLNEYFSGRKIIFLLLGCFEIVMILLYGSRGAILCVAVYIILKLLFDVKSWHLKLTCVILIVLGGLFFNFYKNQIGRVVLDCLISRNYYSRTLTMMFMDEATDLSKRDIIWQDCVEMIKQKPIIGWGIAGELADLTKRERVFDGVTTPHNGFLELMLHHGVLVGTGVGIFFVLSIGRIFGTKDIYLRNLMLICYAAFMTTTMTVGDGYLIKPGVWLYLFLFIASLKKINYGNQATQHRQED